MIESLDFQLQNLKIQIYVSGRSGRKAVSEGWILWRHTCTKTKIFHLFHLRREHTQVKCLQHNLWKAGHAEPSKHLRPLWTSHPIYAVSLVCTYIVQNVQCVLTSKPLGPLYPSHTITSGLLFPVVPFSRSQLTRVLTHHSAEMQLSKSAQIAASRTKATINARTYTRMHVALWYFPSTLCPRFIDRTANTLTGLVIISKCRGKYGKVLSSYDQSKSIAKLLAK